MSRRRGIILAVVAIATAAGVSSLRLARQAEAAVSGARTRAQLEREIRSADAALYMRRAAEDPMSAEDRAMAAGLLLQRAREGGGRSDYVLAGQYAASSLALRESHNGKARLALASALLAQHRFPEALAATRQLLDDQPDEPRYRALLAELLVEVGDYDAAGAQFDTLAGHRTSLAVAPRYARYLEFRGETAKALRILSDALVDARTQRDLPVEQVAWFGLRLADSQLRSGSIEHAGRTIGAALKRSPDDARLWSLQARFHAVRSEWREAIAAADRAGDAADLQTMALAGDAWAALGDSARARDAWAATEASAIANPEPFNRQWTLFRLEHSLALAATRELLEREIGVRHDVFGWAQLAFARLLTGDADSAESSIQRALATGTRDAWLWYVAGRIAEARGERDAAQARFARALVINPSFHHRYASDTRARLRAMK